VSRQGTYANRGYGIEMQTCGLVQKFIRLTELRPLILCVVCGTAAVVGWIFSQISHRQCSVNTKSGMDRSPALVT